MDETRRPYGTHPTAELSAYVDDELDAGRRAELDTHIAGCSRCLAIVTDLTALRGAAATLEERPPEHDLWPAIRDRIAASPRARAVPIEARAPRARRVALTWPQLAAAAIALVVIGGGSVWLALGGGTPTPGTGASTAARRAAPGTASEGVLVVDFADETYEAAVADLEQALEASRDQLEPATVATIERNLEIIDEAIGETRRALAADPNSGYLSAHLADQMRRKLDVLRSATTTVADASI